MLSNNPIVSAAEIKADPPYEKSGSGTPITGARPNTIATLMAAGQSSVPTSPMASAAPKRSFELRAIKRAQG